jgi:hypothetical protein
MQWAETCTTFIVAMSFLEHKYAGLVVFIFGSKEMKKVTSQKRMRAQCMD